MKNTFTFSSIPTTLEQLQALPEHSLDTPFKTAALALLVLCHYQNDPAATIEMLNDLKGPAPLSVYDQQFLRDRLAGKGYKPFSFFDGAAPANNYTPTLPYTVTVRDNPYSYTDENYAMLYLTSGGADSPRGVKLRKKGGQWFLWEQFLLSDIRTPAKDDPWA